MKSIPRPRSTPALAPAAMQPASVADTTAATTTHTRHAFCFTAAFLMGVTDCDCAAGSQRVRQSVSPSARQLVRQCVQQSPSFSCCCRTCAMCRLSVAHKRKEFCLGSLSWLVAAAGGVGGVAAAFYRNLILSALLVIVQMHWLKVSLELLFFGFFYFIIVLLLLLCSCRTAIFD